MIRTFLLIASLCVPLLSHAQVNGEGQKESSPYELLSGYYNQGFEPFKKRNWYAGFAFSLTDRAQNNTIGLFQNVEYGETRNYKAKFKAGYYLGNYFMAGMDFDVNQEKFQGSLVRDVDTIRSDRISRAFGITPNIRSSFPLTANERLSFFTIVGFRFGIENSLTRESKNLDEIQKLYGSTFTFWGGVSPGITFFAMENFAFEIQLNLIGYNLSVSDEKLNEGEASRTTTHNVNFNINLLSLEMGIAYHFIPKD
jgi:hypothetical protein